MATRVNRELSGTRSLFTSSARKAKKLEAPFKESLIEVNKKWGQIRGMAGSENNIQVIDTIIFGVSVRYEIHSDGNV